MEANNVWQTVHSASTNQTIQSAKNVPTNAHPANPLAPTVFPVPLEQF